MTAADFPAGSEHDALSQLDDAQRELTELLYAITHDVRAPLRVIDGFSQALAEDYAADLAPEAREYLATIRSAVSRMDRLFDAVLQLSRISQAPLRRSEVDATAVAEQIVRELRVEDPAREVRVVIAPALVVQADPALFRVALEHLLRNAWKFTAAASDALIELGRVEAARVEVDRGMLFVRDNGAGYDPAAAARMFGPFQRFHSAAEEDGVGIGLAVTRRIVHRHGGRIRATGALQQGMTVYLEFP